MQGWQPAFNGGNGQGSLRVFWWPAGRRTHLQRTEHRGRRSGQLPWQKKLGAVTTQPPGICSQPTQLWGALGRATFMCPLSIQCPCHPPAARTALQDTGRRGRGPRRGRRRFDDDDDDPSHMTLEEFEAQRQAQQRPPGMSSTAAWPGEVLCGTWVLPGRGEGVQGSWHLIAQRQPRVGSTSAEADCRLALDVPNVM